MDQDFQEAVDGNTDVYPYDLKRIADNENDDNGNVIANTIANHVSNVDKHFVLKDNEQLIVNIIDDNFEIED